MVVPVAAASALGGIISGLGGLLGGNAQKDAAEDAIQLQYDTFGHSDRLTKQMYEANLKDLGYGKKEINNLLRGAYQDTSRNATMLRNYGQKQSKRLERENKNIYGNARARSITENANVLRQNRNLADNTYRRGMGLAADARDAGLKNAAVTKQQNIAGFDEAQAAGLKDYQPAYNLGTNALRAYASNLGVGKAPAGYSMELTPGTKFLMEEGRDITEGGAAGGGNLYSGATLEALEKKRMGLAATDRDTQMSQLFSLGGVGMDAASARAGIRSDYSGKIADERSDALATGNALRDKYAARGIGLDENRAGSITDARNLALATGNQIRGNYSDRLAGINTDAFKNNYAIEGDWRNGLNEMRDNFGVRRAANTENMLSMLRTVRSDRANLMGGAATNLASGGMTALGGLGDAKASMWGSVANGLNNALSNWSFNKGVNGGNPAFAPPTGWATPSKPSWQ